MSSAAAVAAAPVRNEPVATATPSDVEPSHADLTAPVPVPIPVPIAAVESERTSAAPAGPTAPKAAGEPRKAKVAETVRVESDRLDYLMNLAGELVINKARFFGIAEDLEDLFRGSNAQALASDTLDRIDSVTRGLEGIDSLERDQPRDRSIAGPAMSAGSARTSGRSR